MEDAVKTSKFEKFSKASELLKAISYPYRLEILKLLEDEEYHSVSEIQNSIGIEASLLSHHLSKMKDRGIIVPYREGRYIYYKLSSTDVIKVLDCIDKCNL